MIGILGGTFDPVHHGHLRLALEMRARLQLARVCLVPSYRSVHRAQPSATPEQRLTMLRTAIEGVEGLAVDAREVRRGGPSYTIDTLGSFRDEHPDLPIVLAIGMDQLRALHTWHRWEQLLDLVHLAVAARDGDGAPESGPVGTLCRERGWAEPDAIRDDPAGRIVLMDTPRLDISSSRIRSIISGEGSARFLLPGAVLRFIEREELYLHA